MFLHISVNKQAVHLLLTCLFHMLYVMYSCNFFMTGVQCYPQRAALLKSMLNFLKKAIPDPSFSDSIRHCKELFFY